MRNTVRAVALLLALSPALAAAQTYPNMPANSVVGRGSVPSGGGPAQAIPFASLIANLLSGPLTVPSVNTSSIVYKGSTSGQATIAAQAVAGTPTIKWPTATGTLADSATSPLVLDPVTGILTCPSCLTSTAGIPQFIASRAAATGLNLSGSSVVMTGGYSAAGDGGRADFKNIGSAAFLDTSIATGSITAGGSAYTNGTYFGIFLSNGTGNLAQATVIVSGGAVTSITLTGISPGYTAGDVLTIPNALIGGTGTGFTWTVATITAPTGSFTDSVGTHFQIIYPAHGLDARAMGVKFDWTTTAGDAGSTDNFTTLGNAMTLAGAQIGNGVDTGGSIGGLVLIPRGAAMMCGSNGSKALQVPYGVTVRGHGPYESVIKICDAWGVGTNYVELCNSQSHLACFATMLDGLQIFASAFHEAGLGVSSVSAVYSNNIQQEGAGLRNVTIYPGACRRGLTLETGYGGASSVVSEGIEIKGGETNANCAGAAGVEMFINYGTTLVKLFNTNLGGLSSTSGGPRASGLLVQGGFVSLDTFYAENVYQPLIVNIQTSLANGMVVARNITAGAGCGAAVSLVSTNLPGNFLIGGPMAVNSCSIIVSDAQAGGSNMTSPQVSDKIFNP